MNWLKKYYYLFPVLLYLPALSNFFSGDDWFHLRLIQIDSFQQFFNYFSFSQNQETASFYRPFSTQVFFFLFQKLFGLTAWPYYLFGLILFAYILYLIKKLSEVYLSSTTYHLRSTIYHLPSIIYGLSVSNFTRVYFLSAYQELFLVTFSLLTLINYKVKPKLSLLFFILALMSKETAIVLPALILLLNYKYIKNNFQSLRFTIYSATILSVVYLNYRLLHFGLATGDSYLWNFSPTKMVNTLGWYTAWSFGAPELLVDYVGSGLRLIPRFFIDYPYWWPIIVFPLLILLIGTLVAFLFNLYRHREETKSLWRSPARGLLQYFVIRNDSVGKFALFFFISLLPVLFLPQHKFALELGLPLVGFSLALAMLLAVSSKFKILSFCFFVLFIFYNLSMNYLTYTRHYSVSRSHISKKIYEYFSQNYPTPPEYQYFEFINDAQDNGNIWGQSKQISQSLSGSEFFRVFYHQHAYKVYYHDTAGERPSPLGFLPIEISTKKFLNQ